MEASNVSTPKVPDLELPLPNDYVSTPVRILHTIKARWTGITWQFLVELENGNREWIETGLNGWLMVNTDSDLGASSLEQPLATP
jgi:hypothetical protein